MKKKLWFWASRILMIALFLILIHSVNSLIAYGIFGTIAAIGLISSGDGKLAAETFLQIAFYVTSAACVIPGLYTLFKLLGKVFPPRSGSQALPLSTPLAIAALVLQISVYVVAAAFPDSPYMAIYIPCFILLGVLMLADWIRRKKQRGDSRDPDRS